MHQRVQWLIEHLRLQPHPEGGFYRELYRSTADVQPVDSRSRRAALTTIYFLLVAGMHSRWHRVLSDEVWHFYEGEPLRLLAADGEFKSANEVILSQPALECAPVHTVPAGYWQAAVPQGSYALVGCTVAPGFEFEDFSFLEQPQLQARLRLLRPEWTQLI